MIEHIGRFQIIEKLGEGAMAIVYKAYDPSIHRTLAVKILHEKNCKDAEYRRRFLREAKAAGHLAHPNIVTVYDVGESNDRPYIMMEFLEGTPLDEILKDGNRLPLLDVIIIGIQLAKALDYAHSKGIVHRDIKPSNIILQKENSIKITDFGIARMEDTTITHQTQMGEILGTPQYMSPEQACGHKVDGRSDLFSVGVILYQLLTGQKAFGAETLATLLLQITTEDPPSLKKIMPELHASIRNVVEKLLEKKPDKRFQTGGDLSQALIRILQDVKEEERRKAETRIVPISVKWTIVMALIVTLTMIVSSILIHRKQYEAMRNQALDYGGSLAKFIATESAIPILSEDWVSIELFVQETKERKEFKYLTIVDHLDIVRGSSDPNTVGKEYEDVVKGEMIESGDDKVSIYSRELHDGTKAYDIKTPILFQNKEVGLVQLGLSQESLQMAARLTLFMMILLMVITVAAVVVVSYLISKRLLGPISLLKNALYEIKDGNFSYRISAHRNDEFGQLFVTFNDMAASLHQGYDEADAEETDHEK